MKNQQGGVMKNFDQNKVTTEKNVSKGPLKSRLKTRILVDGGDPEETRRVKDLLGFVDGQTTNPSLIAKNPEIRQLIASGHRLSEQEENQEYKKIVQQISPLVGDAGVSIEVFSDLTTTAEQMFRQGKEMYSWVGNGHIKYPCSKEGLQAAEMSVAEGIRVNMTLCFSQAQAAAVYAATKGSREPAYVSPFIGRLDDHGENGVDLISNIKRMYAEGDGHVLVLAASIRNLQHLLYAFWAGAELTTVPVHVLEEWAAKGFPLPDAAFQYEPLGAPIRYQELDLNQPWQSFNLEHELTRKGIEKFAADYRATLYQNVA
jgi:transaldolase